MESTSINIPSHQSTLSREINFDDSFDSIIAMMPGHVYWKNKYGVFLGCNDNQARTLGLKSRDEVIGKSTYDMVWSGQSGEERRSQADIIDDTDRAIMESGETQTLEEPLVLPNGEVATYLSIKTPLYNSCNEVVGILGMSFDITSKKHEEEILIYQKKQMQELVNNMHLIAASLSHELRTPMASLRLASSYLKDIVPSLIESYRLAKKSGLSLPTISNRHLDGLSVIVDNMNEDMKSMSAFLEMSLSNLNEGAISKDNFSKVSLSNVVYSAMSEYPFSVGEASLISINIEDDFSIFSEQKLLKHVLFNLIKNALWFIRCAGKGDITIKVTHADGVGRLIFEDTGSGIKDEDLPHIFEKFYSKRDNGTGVGLAFCKMVVETSDGVIRCESEKGCYTRFILTFNTLC